MGETVQEILAIYLTRSATMEQMSELTGNPMNRVQSATRRLLKEGRIGVVGQAPGRGAPAIYGAPGSAPLQSTRSDGPTFEGLCQALGPGGWLLHRP